MFLALYLFIYLFIPLSGIIFNIKLKILRVRSSPRPFLKGSNYLKTILNENTLRGYNFN